MAGLKSLIQALVLNEDEVTKEHQES